MPSPPLLKTSMEPLDNGRRLRVARLGTEQRGTPIVMLHGYPENLQIWSRLAPLLAQRQEVIALDWPGMGHSDVWPGGATPQLQANRLLAILDQWKLPEAILVGADMGAQPVLVLAAQHPDRVVRLVVMNSLVFGNERTSWEIRLLRRFGFNRFAMRHLAGLVFHRAESTFLPRGSRLDPAMRDDFWTAFSKPQVRRFISKMCAGYQGTLDRLPELYRKIVCPTLIVWAEHDKHFPLIQAERLHESIPGSRLEVILKGTHWMALPHAEEIAARMLGFMG